MKMKRAYLAIAITALVVTVLLISLRAYYVAIALIAGALIIGHRELWSLLRSRKLPPIDERVREKPQVESTCDRYVPRYAGYLIHG